jgi:hypothetical protein
MKLQILRAGIVCSIIALSISCGKPKLNVAPNPDTNTADAIETMWMVHHISDIEMVCAFIAEQDAYDNAYKPMAISGNGTMTPIFDIASKTLFQAYNQTKCTDNLLRDGTINLNFKYQPDVFPRQTRNSVYMHEYGYAGQLTLSEYVVNGYRIKTHNGVPALIINQLSSADADVSQVKLSWAIRGDFEIIHPQDAAKVMRMEVNLLKTLENSTNPSVYPKNGYIRWEDAIVSYSGVLKGTNFDGTAFTLTVSPEAPLVRDFNCVPDLSQGGVVASASPLRINPGTFHPFVTGVAAYLPEGRYRREIYFGNEGDQRLSYQCDNKATVLIKGNLYTADLMPEVK